MDIEEFSMAKLKEMSDQEVYDRMAYLHELEEAIKAEGEKCRSRLGIAPQRTVPEKCVSCGSSNLDPRVRGGYFCRKCGYRDTGLA